MTKVSKRNIFLILGFSISISIFLILVFINQLAIAGIFGILFLIVSMLNKNWRIEDGKYLPILLVEVILVIWVLWLKVR